MKDTFYIIKWESDKKTVNIKTTGNIEYLFEITRKDFKVNLNKISRYYCFTTNKSFYETLEEECGLKFIS